MQYGKIQKTFGKVGALRAKAQAAQASGKTGRMKRASRQLGKMEDRYQRVTKGTSYAQSQAGQAQYTQGSAPAGSRNTERVIGSL